MIQLAHTADWAYMLLIAAGIGAIGGLGAELVLNRAGGTGMLDLPHSVKESNLISIGFPSSLIVGAIAAVAVLYFFPPVVEKVVTSTQGAAPTIVSQYDLAKLVPLALIVGSAGPAFLATAQSRLMSALNAQKAGAAADTAKVQVDRIAASATAAVGSAVQSAVSAHMPGADPKVVREVADAATTSVKSSLDPQVAGAHAQVDAITPKSASESDGAK